MSAESLSAVAAFLSFLATSAAAWTAWKGPQRAAEVAEQLRQQSMDRDEKRRMQLWIFTTVMQNRAAVWNNDAVRALNLIDFSFGDSQEVRRTWARLLGSYDPNSGSSENEKKNHLRDLLGSMATVLGLQSTLNDADFDRIYYPTAHMENDLAQMIFRQSIIRGQGQSPSSNQPPPLPKDIFPPRPN